MPRSRLARAALSIATIGLAIGVVFVAAPASAQPEDTGGGIGGVPETQVRATVDAWLAAQNRGNLAAYKALYARRFEGIQHIGAQTRRFDRKGWLAERTRAFKTRMSVEATDLDIISGTASARVELRQTLSQGGAMGEHKKQLVLVMEGGALRIAREETMASELSLVPAANGVYMVLPLYDQPYLFLRADADPDWGKGRLRQPTEVNTSGPNFLAFRDAPAAPRSLAAWKGRTVRLYDADGVSCQGTVGPLELVAGGTPSDADIMAWFGSSGVPAWSDARRAEAVFAMASPYLVARLTVDKGCAPVVAVDGKPPLVYDEPERTADDDALVASASAAFRALPEFQRLQQSFRAEYAGKGAWAEPALEIYERDGKRFVSITARREGGCGSFQAHLWAFYEVTGSGLRLRNDPASEAFAPTFVLDANRDGKPEILSGWTYLVPSGDTWSIAAQLAFPFDASGC